MRFVTTVVAVAIALAAASARAEAGDPAAVAVPPGSALVALPGDPAIVAVVPIRLGVAYDGVEYDGVEHDRLEHAGLEHAGFAPRTVLSFGGDDSLPSSFAFTLGPVQPIEPLPSTVTFLAEHGIEGAGVAAFVLADRDAQLVMLVPPEVTRAALAAGRLPDLGEVERSIPSEVAADLQYLRERREAAARTHVATLTVREPDAAGAPAEHHGLGMVEIRFDEAAAEAGIRGEAHYAGSFWGGFETESGPAWLEGRFAGVPFELTTHPWFRTDEERWDAGSAEPHGSRFAALWPEPYPVVGIAASVPQAWDALEHHLRVELLLEPGGWTAVADTPLPPVPESPGPSLADDPEAEAFLARLGLTEVQFEHLLGLGQGPLMLVSWQARGISSDDVPTAILERIEAEAAPAAERTGAGAAGWSQTPPGLLSHKALSYRLPEPLHARGVRFELHGAPFRGEHWELRVETGPVPRPGGDVSYTWRYLHGW